MTSECEIDEKGNKRWYLNGKLHRTVGPAAEDKYGNKFWFVNDDLHREDGPAVEFVDGTKKWYLNDKLHREDGPAIERKDGTKEWYINGNKLTKDEFKNRMILKCSMYYHYSTKATGIPLPVDIKRHIFNYI